MRGHGMRVAVAVAAVGLILAARLSGVRCKPNVIQVCGSELADILQRACSGGYHTYENLANGTRKKRGIYQECCRQPCSYKEILQYCSESDTTSLPETDSASVADHLKSRRDRKCRNVVAANSRNEAVTDRVDEQRQQQQDLCGDTNDLDPPTKPPPLPQSSPKSPLDGHATDGKPPHEEARENMTTTTTTPTAGLHSKKPYFVGKVPALVLNISKKFSFGS